MSEKILQLNEKISRSSSKISTWNRRRGANELLEKEAEALTQAARHERSEDRKCYRSSHYDCNLTTTSSNVTLHMLRLK